MKLEQYSINIKKIMTILIAFFHNFFYNSTVPYKNKKKFRIFYIKKSKMVYEIAI